LGLGSMVGWAKHWHQQFHVKYADPAALAALIKARGVTTWVDLLNANDAIVVPIKIRGEAGQAATPSDSQ
jgi:hypothetical protein